MIMKKAIHTSGKRKRAIARATLTEGKGMVRFNKLDVNHLHPKHLRLKLLEPLMLVPEYEGKLNVSITVHGGGTSGQIDAARLALGRALVEYAPSTSKLRERFKEYDWGLLTADVRYKEPNKPNDSKARAKRQKSYR